MRTRITIKGQVTLPRRVREVLRLAPGDGVEFTSNERGEVVITRQIAAPRAAGQPDDGVWRCQAPCGRHVPVRWRG
ncbi:MAG TPA: type II toxin-antitoxin system PrlF family antitoxin [Candidatus Dormibacteraeota bacterium]|nr:type II toxin-antitoxin system PrlF family antitoxin [Candidatus Dormibacteraeota bacterium]